MAVQITLRANRLSRKIPVFFFFLVLLTMTSPASAQTSNERNRDRELNAKTRIESDLQSAQFRFGHLYVLSSFNLGDIGIDRDIYLPTEEETNDLAISISAPQKIYYVPHRKFMLSADIEPSYLYFVHDKERRRLNYRYRGDIHFLFNRLYLDFYGATSDELTRNISEFRRLVGQQGDSYGMNTELKISSRTTVEGAADWRRYTFENTNLGELYRDPGNLDRDEFHYSATFNHQTFPLTQTGIGAEVTEFDFTDPTQSDARQSMVFLELRQNRSNTTLTFRPGFARLDFDDPALKDYSGALGSLQAQFGRQSRWRWNLGASRELEFSIFGTNRFYSADRFQATTSRKMTRRLELHLIGEKGINRYYADTPTSVSGVQTRKDDLWYGAVGFLFQLGKLQTGLTYGYWRRDSNIEGFDDHGIRLILHLSFSPGLG